VTVPEATGKGEKRGTQAEGARSASPRFHPRDHPTTRCQVLGGPESPWVIELGSSRTAVDPGTDRSESRRRG
jgi:hypothetical protein